MAIVKATVKGHVVIPVEIRKKYNIRKGSRVHVTDDGEGGIKLMLVPEDPIGYSRGILKGKTSILESLIKDRRDESKRG